MPLRKLVAILLVSFPGLGFASTNGRPEIRASFALQEKKIWAVPARETEFAAIGHTSRASCRANRPPEALATPSPLLAGSAANSRVKVSFIIGTDGRVHSPFILESAGPVGDQVVLETVRFWRFRPATCNGVPTEAEARIGFSGR
jgi:TonB family protein